MAGVVFTVGDVVAPFDEQVVQAAIAVEEPLVAADIHPEMEGTDGAVADEVKDDSVVVAWDKGA